MSGKNVSEMRKIFVVALVLGLPLCSEGQERSQVGGASTEQKDRSTAQRRSYKRRTVPTERHTVTRWRYKTKYRRASEMTGQQQGTNGTVKPLQLQLPVD